LNVSARSVQGASKVLRDGAPELARAVDEGKIAVSTAAVLADAPKEKQGAIVARGAKAAVQAAAAIRSEKTAAKLTKPRAPAPSHPAALARASRAETPAAKGLAAVATHHTRGDASEEIRERFHTIVIAPLWPEVDAESPASKGETRRTMSLEAIRALPVSALAHQDCVLWLWTTNAHVRDALGCLDAWGFREQTLLTWVKDRAASGLWLKDRTEHCLVALRGNPDVLVGRQTTVIDAAARGASRKPEQFFTLVEELCRESKLEMLCREDREGWTSWDGETGHAASG
jgi:N6-adenosine-specific RNA methylase IME4